MCSIAQPVTEETPLGLPLKRKRRRKKDMSTDDYDDGATLDDNSATSCGGISLEGNNEREAVNMTVPRKKGTRKKKRQETTMTNGANYNPVNFLSGTDSAVPESAEIQSLSIASLSDMKQNFVEQTVIETQKKRKRKKPKNSVPLDENTCLEGSTGDKNVVEETSTLHSVSKETSKGHDDATVGANPAADCGNTSLTISSLYDMEQKDVEQTVVETPVPASSHLKKKRKKPKNSVPLDENACLEGNTGEKKNVEETTTPHVNRDISKGLDDATVGANPASDCGNTSVPIASLCDMEQKIVEQTVAETPVPASSNPKKKRKKPKNSVPLDENTCLEGSTGDKKNVGEITPPHVNREVSQGIDDATVGANPATDCGNASVPIASLCDMKQQIEEQTVAETPVPASSNPKKKRKKPKNSVPLDENNCLEGSTGDKKNLGETMMPDSVSRKISKGHDDATVGDNPTTDCGNTFLPIASLCKMEQNLGEQTVVETPASSNPKKKRKKPKNSVSLDENICLEGSTGDKKNVGETATLDTVTTEISKGQDDATAGDNPATESSHPKKKRKKKSVPLDENTCVEASTGDKKNVGETMTSPSVNREMCKGLDAATVGTNLATDCGNASVIMSTCLEENSEPRKDVAEMTIPRKKLPKRSGKILNATDANSNPVHIFSATESASPESAAIKSPPIASSCVIEQNIVGKNVVEIEVPALSHQKKKKKRKKSDAAKDFVPLDENTCKEGKMIGRENPPETILPQALSLPLTKVVGSPKRKLLVLDLNGLLADFVCPQPKDVRADFQLKGKAVFKRPYCDYFLDFCFERFDVGIWSSRTRVNLDRAVDFLLGHKRRKLLFCWCQDQCTKTRSKTMDDKRKPLVLKELRKLWEWKEGVYDKSNTLLLDDSPYKALLNPPYTAVFPHPYSYMERRVDRVLGPEGFLRNYLEKLASSADDVQTFVKENRYGHGQMPITESHSDWPFYSEILKYLNGET